MKGGLVSMQNCQMTYQRLFDKFQIVKEQAVDEQIILMCKRNGTVPMSYVLSQFKFCLKHNIKDDRYESLSSYLVNRTNKPFLLRLEESFHEKC